LVAFDPKSTGSPQAEDLASAVKNQTVFNPSVWSADVAPGVLPGNSEELYVENGELVDVSNVKISARPAAFRSSDGLGNTREARILANAERARTQQSLSSKENLRG